MFPLTLPTKTTQETAMPGPLGASNRYRTAVREQFEALHRPEPDAVKVQPDSDPFKVDTKAEPSRPVSQAPNLRPTISAPARLPYSHPTRRAEREVQRAKAKVQHAERVAKYIKDGVDAAEADHRARYDSYQEITRAS
jgi:hypothetical protein